MTIKELRESLNNIGSEFDDVEIDVEDMDDKTYSLVNINPRLDGFYPDFTLIVKKDKWC